MKAPVGDSGQRATRVVVVVGNGGKEVPGTLKSTTFLPAHSLLASYSWGIPQAVASVSVMGAHL